VSLPLKRENAAVGFARGRWNFSVLLVGD